MEQKYTEPITQFPPRGCILHNYSFNTRNQETDICAMCL